MQGSQNAPPGPMPAAEGRAPAAGFIVRADGAANAVALTFLVFAPVWDAAGYAGLLPPWWPPVSYVMIGFGIAVASLGVLSRTLQRRRTSRQSGAHEAVRQASDARQASAARGVAYAPARGAALELLAIGLFLAAWLLRGDAEIPPDPPLVAAQLAAMVGVVLAALRRMPVA
jgi:hypothetical protein